MRFGRVCSSLASLIHHPPQAAIGFRQSPLPTFQFSEQWSVLGPFEIGTREAVWGADPLEFHGGFRALEYDQDAIFRSSLAVNGTTGWSNITGNLTDPGRFAAGVDFLVDFSNVEWETLRNVYGWAAYQWQAWIRGDIIVQSDKTEVLTLHIPQILELWLDDVHYWGGDFYSYDRAPPALHLESGKHRLDIRLVRDVRAMGGVGEPTMSISLALRKSQPVLHIDDNVVISDTIKSANGSGLASPFASVILRNDGEDDVIVFDVDATHNACISELYPNQEIRIVPGQSRPVALRVRCVRLDWAINLDFRYKIAGQTKTQTRSILVNPGRRNPGEPHKVTFPHPGGIVSYAILRPPSQRAIDTVGPNASLPILLTLHGAGVEAEWDDVRLALQPLQDLPAWVVFPTGVTPWSGDDWHQWGLADVEAATEMIPDWMQVNEWSGPGVDTKKWIVAGHSNGGQGTWYMLTHRPDNVIAAAPLSGYSSIQTYVPYTFWKPADPGRTAIVQSALSSYRHELLLPNAKGIPVLQQHGGADDNVPPYHARLQAQLIREASAESDYLELAGKPHFWDGVFTTDPLKEFYQRQVDNANAGHATDARQSPRDFSLVVANPGDTGAKNGVKIVNLRVPGRTGRIEFLFNLVNSACVMRTSNIRTFYLPSYFGEECKILTLDAQNISLPLIRETQIWKLTMQGGIWLLHNSDLSVSRPLFRRLGRQLGQMDSILRTEGPFSIVEHSNNTRPVALQISRNLCQYLAADTSITNSYRTAFTTDGNIISIVIGDDLPPGLMPNHPFRIENGKISIRSYPGDSVYEYTADLGLAAAFLRPLPLGRLELVIWGSDEVSLEIAARLVPMMPGSGQPDFVIADRRMLAKGLDGVLALGFFDDFWEVSANSFFA